MNQTLLYNNDFEQDEGQESLASEIIDNGPNDCEQNGLDTFIPDSINNGANDHSNRFKQNNDLTQMEQSSLNTRAHYNNSPCNCTYASSACNRPLNTQATTRNYDPIPNNKEQQRMPLVDNVNSASTSQYFKNDSPAARYINNNVNEDGPFVMQHSPPHYTHNHGNAYTIQDNLEHRSNEGHVSTTQYSPSNINCHELFRLEISGMEIIFRQKPLTNLNQSSLEMRNDKLQRRQQNEQSNGRIQNRMHPYHPPFEQNRRPIMVNNRNHAVNNSSPQQQYLSHPCPHSCFSTVNRQQNYISSVDGTTSNGNFVNPTNLRNVNNQFTNDDSQLQFQRF
ncbi:7122_t:CDS:1 [Funneliformis mosseae]|uniref:7122_t:CDS:1 n=1 Tax=Funneliformis mosseae TaxID=27381 RepID=A0A9N9D033_FUNMO|nr:7122_t:CDS:1 [Funneliformis mosseae]